MAQFSSYFIGLFALFLAVTSVTCQGHGCDDDPQPDPSRVPCPLADHDTVEPGCRALNCTWCPTVPDTPIPWCYVSTLAGTGYVMVGEPVLSPNGAVVQLQLEEEGRKARAENEFTSLVLEAIFDSNERLRVKITPGGTTSRWEPPLEIFPAPGGNAAPLYDIQFENAPLFTFKVVRVSTSEVLFDTSSGQKNFIFADQYLSLTWQLSSENVYGIGENEQTSFRHDFSAEKKYPLWARDHTPEGTVNIYGVQPYYTVLEKSGSAHSVALVNSNAQEFHMKTGGVISYVTIGGIFDIYFFLGPTPENTVQQYVSSVGRAPLPPYWGLGFQLCRYGYDSIANMKAAVDRTREYDIPHDVQYGDIDIMRDQLDFTYDTTRFAGLPAYIKELKTEGIKFVTILDPCISIGEPIGSYPAFDSGQAQGVWVYKADGVTPTTGRVWPKDPVYFPDYSNPKTREWWINLIVDFHDLLEYDGLWIDMNEPANFVDGDIDGGCPANKWNSPSYIPPVFGGSLWSFTVCMDCVQTAGIHYDTHSMYGWFQSEPTLTATEAGTGKRSLVLTRSTFLGSGRWTAHWLGDNFSRWSNLHFSIIGMLQYNQFGIPMCGSDICGFNDNTTPEMCQRWQQLGSFYPFSRNHNAIFNTEQDPGVFGPAIANSTRTALRIRYTLLPYLYTLFYNHNIRGDTVARALWHEFPMDNNTHGIDRQFLWGSGLLVSPVIDEGATSVSAYFPNSPFYDYYTGAEVTTKGASVTLPAPLEFIPVHIHGGNILPTQEPARNTDISRNNPFGLIVALSGGSATGQLYFDDGDTIDPVAKDTFFLGSYTAVAKTLTATVEKNNYPGMATKVLDTVRLLGATAVSGITVNGTAHTDFEILASGEVLITNLGIPANSPFVLTY